MTRWHLRGESGTAVARRETRHGQTATLRSGRSRGAHAKRLTVTVAAAVTTVVAGCSAPGASSKPSTEAGGTQSSAKAAAVTVWADQTRTPGVKEYIKSHPKASINLVTIPKTAGYVLSKIALDNKAAEGWPDVVFLNTPEDVASLADARFKFAQALNGLVDQSTIDGFADGAMGGCTFKDQVYCLRSDLGQTVLWYNAKLMADFGYQVPKTWKEYQAIGLKVAEDHPGYVVGNIQGKWGAGTYFASSGCPTRDVIDLQAVRIDTTATSCTRVAQMLSPLLANGTVSTLAYADPAFVKIGAEDKVLMMPGPSWYGDYVFEKSFKTPAGEMAAALMPKWPGESKPYSGSVGGGAWVVSQHAADKAAAVDVARWMTTNVDYLTSMGTYPAFAKAAESWGKALKDDKFYATDPFTVMQQEAALIQPTFGWVRYVNEWSQSFDATIVAAGTSGKPLNDALAEWGDQLGQAAKAADYTIQR